MRVVDFQGLKYFFVGLSGLLLCNEKGIAQHSVDVHSHIILPEYLAILEKHGAAMDETFPLPHWNAASHVRFMEQAGIEYAVLSMPARQPYFGDTKETSSTKPLK